MQAWEQVSKIRGAKANLGTDPTKFHTRAIPITGATVVFDILGDGSRTPSNPGILPRAEGRFVKMVANVATFFIWSDDPAQLLDDAATGAATPTSQCDVLAANVAERHYPQGRYLAIKGSAGILRISVSSE